MQRDAIDNETEPGELPQNANSPIIGPETETEEPQIKKEPGFVLTPTQPTKNKVIIEDGGIISSDEDMEKESPIRKGKRRFLPLNSDSDDNPSETDYPHGTDIRKVSKKNSFVYDSVSDQSGSDKLANSDLEPTNSDLEFIDDTQYDDGPTCLDEVFHEK